MFSNFALWYHKDIDHWVIYHLKDVCEMYRRSFNKFSWIIVVPCGGVVDINVNFDTWIVWMRQMCGWLFLRQNVRAVNLSITHEYLFRSLSFNVSRSSGNSNSNLASMMSNFGLGLRQFGGTIAQSLRFFQNMILQVIFIHKFQHIYLKLLLEWNNFDFSYGVSFVSQYRIIMADRVRPQFRGKTGQMNYTTECVFGFNVSTKSWRWASVYSIIKKIGGADWRTCGLQSQQANHCATSAPFCTSNPWYGM